jgi:alcohol dehydrogenase class IV
MSTILYLTNIEFGPGSLKTLPQALADLAVTRPLLVSDAGLASTGLLDRVETLLGGPAVRFLGVPPNPTEAAVGEALALYSSAGCDGIVAIGGGSPIDLAKGVALLATHPGPLAAYAAIEGGIPRIKPSVAPVVAIPTTAGTGAEVGRAALLSLGDGRKLGFISQHLIPKRVICDPELTFGLPPVLTAATGLDALSHCIETFCSPRFNPPADAIALDGAGRVWHNLERAVSDGRDLGARTEMMMAALEGGLSFQKGLGAVHSLSHALGAIAELKLHHGTLNAVLMPAVLRANADVIAEKVAHLNIAVGLPPDADLAAEIEALNRRIGLPDSLTAMGVTQAMVPGVIWRALADHSHATNPKPLSADDYAAILATKMR